MERYVIRLNTQTTVTEIVCHYAQHEPEYYVGVSSPRDCDLIADH